MVTDKMLQACSTDKGLTLTGLKSLFHRKDMYLTQYEVKQKWLFLMKCFVLSMEYIRLDIFWRESDIYFYLSITAFIHS